METGSFVYIDEHGLKGVNFYWAKRDLIGATKEELTEAGVKNERLQVHHSLIKPLKQVEKELETHGFSLVIKEGYRPKELYKLVYRKGTELYGKKNLDKLFNMEDMPHATGKSVDITLWDNEKKKELKLRDDKDGVEAYFVNYYKDKKDSQSKNFQTLQDLMIKTMLNNGFELGKKKEYFHFNYVE